MTLVTAPFQDFFKETGGMEDGGELYVGNIRELNQGTEKIHSSQFLTGLSRYHILYTYYSDCIAAASFFLN